MEFTNDVLIKMKKKKQKNYKYGDYFYRMHKEYEAIEGRSVGGGSALIFVQSGKVNEELC